MFLVYVDDIVLTSSSPHFVTDTITRLGDEFKLRDLGLVRYFLGIHVTPLDDGSLFLSQQQYASNLLHDLNLQNLKPATTPMEKKLVFPLNDPLLNEADCTKYRRVLGSLQYLTTTRPDISYAVNSSLKIEAFVDADWAGDPSDRRSHGGYISCFGGNIVSWRSAKQQTVARSTTEAEYRSVADAAAELNWIRNVLVKLGVKVVDPMTIWCDNVGATYLAANPVWHSMSKHMGVNYHFIREQVQDHTLRVEHIGTKQQPADLLTKALAKKDFHYLRDKFMGILPINLRGGIKAHK